MLEEIAEDKLSKVAAANQTIFRTDIDYEAIVQRRAIVVQEWTQLSVDVRGTQNAFLIQHQVPDPKDPELAPARNTALLLKEVRGRIDRVEPLALLGVESLDFDDSVLELAESLENITEIREIYKIRKAATGSTKNSGMSSEEAGKLKNCFSQARELFLAGKNGSLMVKPLNFFYALTAYTYGIILLNNPLRYRKDMIPGSHGMTYLPTAIQAQFGGDSPKGTFSDLVGAFPTQLIKSTNLSFHVDCSTSIIEYYNTRFNVSLGTLLSMIPEMADYYKLTTKRNSRCFPLEIVSANDPRSLMWEFQIGNGEVRPSNEVLDNAFNDFPKTERHGKSIVTVPAARASSIRACLYTDVRGGLWFVENPFHPVILPEEAVHFLITSMFSNIMRYRPEEWGNVLLNEVSSGISLLTRHYFSSFQRKFLPLVLRSISRYLPYAA